MNCTFLIFLYFISVFIICTPPPIPKPPYEVTTIESPIQKKNTQYSKNLKRLQDSKQYVANNKVIVEILDEGVSEEHELKITTKNLPTGTYYKSYVQTLSFSDGQTLSLISNECQKFKNTGDEVKDSACTAKYEKNGNNYKFNYEYELFSDEYIIVKYKFTITESTKQILYRQESIYVSNLYSDGFCDYKFIIPEKYKNLGLQNNNFQKESDYIYTYNNNCPSERIDDVIRIAPKGGKWKGEMSFYLESSSPFSGDVTLKFPRLYRGGKNKNDNYEITNDEGNELKESDLITDTIFLNTKLSGINKKKVGVNLQTAFSNNLEEDFDFYPTEDFLVLEQNIDDKIKAKVNEIINDQNSEYKDYPDYYKIGKFINSYMTYDLDYLGRDLTALEIFEEKRGVCEHYTTLYNVMLNYIGIKTQRIFGWAFDKDNTSGDENTIGHAWTLALISNNGNSKYMELDSTWDLFEGVPAGHILKGFNKETYSVHHYGRTDIQNLKTHKIELVSLQEEATEKPSEKSQEESSSEPKNSESKGEDSSSELKSDETDKIIIIRRNKAKNINISKLIYIMFLLIVFI